MHRTISKQSILRENAVLGKDAEACRLRWLNTQAFAWA